MRMIKPLVETQRGYTTCWASRWGPRDNNAVMFAEERGTCAVVALIGLVTLAIAVAVYESWAL
jgi:hypothetical protein